MICTKPHSEKSWPEDSHLGDNPRPSPCSWAPGGLYLWTRPQHPILLKELKSSLYSTVMRSLLNVCTSHSGYLRHTSERHSPCRPWAHTPDAAAAHCEQSRGCAQCAVHWGVVGCTGVRWGEATAPSLGSPPAEQRDCLQKDREARKSEMYCGRPDATGRVKLGKLDTGAK